jgi:predicted RNA-binding protein with PUA-like domain
MQYWLVKSEPETYSWDTFVKMGRDHWDGVRNFQARNHLKAMKADDLVLFYHSGGERAVVGLAKVVREFYQDPTTNDPNWVVVDLVPVTPLQQKVSLATIKADGRLSEIALVRQSRLSVMPLGQAEFDIIIGLSSPE